MSEGFIEKLKELFYSDEGYQPARRMPYKYSSTVWGWVARTMGLGGHRNKELHVVEGRETKTWWPYHEALVEAFESVKNVPNWDETGGQSDPEADFLRVHDPGLIAYNQRDLKRN